MTDFGEYGGALQAVESPQSSTWRKGGDNSGRGIANSLWSIVAEKIEDTVMDSSGAAIAGEGQAESKGESPVGTNGEAEMVSREQLMKDLARSVLGAFGLRPFNVFDGERYHVCFAVAKEVQEEELKCDYDVELLEDFFSHCRRSPKVSNNAHEDPSPSPLHEVPMAAPPVPAPDAEDGWGAHVRENDSISAAIPNSPKEVHYIMEEYYLSPSPPARVEIDHDVENQPVFENQHITEEDEPVLEKKERTVEGKPVLEDNQRTIEKEKPVLDKIQRVPLINPRTLKEIHFVMEDNYLSPEELRLSIYFPSLLFPPTPPNEAPEDVPMEDRPCEAGPPLNGGNVVETPIRSIAGKAKDARGAGPKKKKAKVVEEFDASQSVRPDKPWAVRRSPKKRKATRKTGTQNPPEEEPPWNALNVGDLEEQTGDSWVEAEKLTRLLEDNPGDVVNPGQVKKSFWPTPLYGSSGRQVKGALPSAERGNFSPGFAGSEEESSEVEDLEEPLEHIRKREEVALAKYALLFKDDQSWRRKFLDGFKLTCDICFSKRKIKVFSSVMSLLSHAQEAKKMRQPEHRGYAQAIRNLLHLDEPGNTPACHSVAGHQSFQIEGVWPPVVVLENTVIGVDLEGGLISLNANELLHMLRALGDHGKRKLHPVVRDNGLSGQVLVEFPTTLRGWIDAKHMHRQFELHAKSYEDWLRLKPKFKALLCDATEVQESHGLLAVLADKVSVKRILYGYLATPHVIKYIDPNKQYVDWEIENLRDFFDISDSDSTQAIQR